MTLPAGGLSKWIFFPLFLPNHSTPWPQMTHKWKTQSIPNTCTYIEPGPWLFDQMGSTESNGVRRRAIYHFAGRRRAVIGGLADRVHLQTEQKIVIISVSITHGSAAELWLCNSLCSPKDTRNISFNGDHSCCFPAVDLWGKSAKNMKKRVILDMIGNNNVTRWDHSMTVRTLVCLADAPIHRNIWFSKAN